MPEADIIIIGGGIAGAATAMYLSRLGHGVTLLERGEIAGEASGVNAGGLGGIGWGAVPDLTSYLTMGSLEEFKSLQMDNGYDIEFRQSGTLQAIHTLEQYEYARDRMLRLTSQGHSLELLTPREAMSIEPGANPQLPGYLYLPLRGQADPVKTTRAFASAAAGAGANVLTGQDVTAIVQTSDGGWQVRTSPPGTGGDFRSGALVLAAGAWCRPVGELLGINIPIVPVRGQMWATDSVPPRVFHTIGSVESPYDWGRQSDPGPGAPPELTHWGEVRLTRHLYGRQTKSGEIIFGGDRQMVDYNVTPDATGIEVNRGHASEVLPFLRDLPIARTWAGTMPFPLDGEPIIGKIPLRDNLYIVGGLASSGFGRGPMAGKLLAEYIHSGHRPTVLNDADPARCVSDTA
ncbi:MAG: FAD-binding oxidoreductase [Chloroflexi bacterium]|nr:FAD-binding oxidoreductase [Chloroflexota bacterium]